MADKLGGSLQENLLVLLCWSDSTFQLVRDSVDKNLFTTDIYRNMVSAIYDFIDAHHKPPKDHLPDLLEEELKEKSAGLYKEKIRAVYLIRKTINEEYVLSQLGNFVRQQNLKIGIIKASELIQSGNLEEAEVEIEKALKNRLSLFAPGLTLEEGLKHLVKHGTLRDALPLGIPELDKHHLGPARKELHAFLGPKKGGKTWWLIHLEKRALLMDWPVATITLEVSEQLYAVRTLQSLYSLKLGEGKTQVTRFKKDALGRAIGFEKEKLNRKSLLEPEGQKVASRGLARHSAMLRIKEFPTGSLTINGIQAYLDSLERMYNFIPALLIVDYPKLMRHDPSNLRIELGATLERLRGIGGERNMAVAVVGQINREGVKRSESSGTGVAEDFSINMTADVILTYSQTPGEYQLGLARLGVDASRISKQHFNVMISQNYDLGQFCLDSAPMIPEYKSMVKEMSGKEMDPEEGE